MPNPSSGHFVFEIIPDGRYVLVVHDVLGRVLYAAECSAREPRKYYFNESGTYIYDLKDIDGATLESGVLIGIK